MSGAVNGVRYEYWDYCRKQRHRVRQKVSLSGTGDITFPTSGASIPGFRTFKQAIGDNAYGPSFLTYLIESVDGNGVPLGDWEIGMGLFVYDAGGTTDGTLKRISVLDGTGATHTSKVNFAAGDKIVTITAAETDIPLVANGLKRYRDGAWDGELTIYARWDGDDNNTGMTNTAGGAVRTISRALAIALASGFSVVNITFLSHAGNSIYEGGFSGVVLPPGMKVRFFTTIFSSACYPEGGTWEFDGCTVHGGIYAISPTYPTEVILKNAHTYGRYDAAWVNSEVLDTCALNAKWKHNRISAADPLTFNVYASATYVMLAEREGQIQLSNVAFSGNGSGYTWTTFARADSYLSTIDVESSTIASITATGQRYYAKGNSVIFVNARGANVFPGSTAGAVANQGLYL